jgi:outer membrane protein TolC
MRRLAGPVVAAALLAASARARAESPLTLAEAVRLARARHPAVEAQRAQLLAAHGRREQALAGLLPFLTGSVAYLPSTPNPVATPALARQLFASAGSDVVIDTAGAPVVVSCRTPGVGRCAPLPPLPVLWTLQSFWTAQVGLSWTVWDWGRSLYGYRGARDLAAAAQVGVETAHRDVALEAKLAFFGALAADDQVTIATDAVKTYQAHLAQTRAMHDSGLRTGIDVATAESALASAAVLLARARAGRETARAGLAVALGEDSPRDWRLVAEPATFELQAADSARAAAAPEALTELAFRQRPELAQLGLQARGLAAEVRSARGSYLPQLTLNVGPTWAGTDFTGMVPNFSVGVVLGYGAGGMSPLLVHGQEREATGNLLALEAQERSAREGIRQETVAARALLASMRDELAGARALVEAAARQRALAEGRYQTGIGNVIELYDALLTDVNARFQLVQARLDLASARARLQHALGEDE